MIGPVQKVLRSLEVAAELLEELSKLSHADKAVVRHRCEEYLRNLQVLTADQGFGPNACLSAIQSSGKAQRCRNKSVGPRIL